MTTLQIAGLALLILGFYAIASLPSRPREWRRPEPRRPNQTAVWIGQIIGRLLSGRGL